MAKTYFKQEVIKLDDGHVEPANKVYNGDFMVVETAEGLSILFGAMAHPQDNTRYINRDSSIKFSKNYTIFGKDKATGAPIYAEKESLVEAVGRHFQNKKANNPDPVRTAALTSLYELRPEAFDENPAMKKIIEDYLNREGRATAATTHGVGVHNFEL